MPSNRIDGGSGYGGRFMVTLNVEERGAPAFSRRSRESSVRGQVYRKLLRDIVQCATEPGQSLSEKEVAASLGVSRTPVREAFLQLAEDELVVISPQRGTAVAKISTRQVRQAQFAREVLERAILAVDCQRVTAKAGTGLDAAIYAQRQAAANLDYAAFYDADQLFHAELARLSGLDGVDRLTGGARVHLNRVRWLSLPEPNGIDAAIVQHEEIASAVKAGDAERGDCVLAAHLRSVLDVLPAIRDRFPGYFDTGDEGLPALPDTSGLTIGWNSGRRRGDR
jgi:GntR family transcriptional regulator, rspAB operon transcriptional repressor